MPLGPFKNFSDCVKAQKKQGHSDDAAAKICGAIQKKAEGKESFWIDENGKKRDEKGRFIVGENVALKLTATINKVEE